MVDCSRNGGHDFNMASRKAEEAAWRRYDASQWLESQVGPLGISKQPTERELVSCLRNGLVLCNVINKIHPGAVPKVVDIPVASQPLSWDSQPLPAYQYFENVRNFLVAAEELKIPAFEASDLERDSVDMGSASKVVECILSLKSFQESEQINNESDSNKQIKFPLQMQSASRMHSKATTAYPSDACRPLDLSVTLEKTPPIESNFQQREESVESIVRLLVDRMLDAKENINGNIHASLSNGLLDPIKLFNQILSNGGGEQPLKKLPEDIIKERTISQPHSTSTPASSYALPASKCPKCHRTCIGKCTCSQQQLLEMQKKELLDLKALKLKLKVEFEEMQSQFQRFFNDLGSQVQEMSVNALGYHKVVEENRKLYNMVQDLKGNIRVYCRIRPSFRANTKSIMDFVGENGSLLILDPSKTLKDGRKHFQFNEVFGPTASQDEVFKRTQPLIRSVMDGYNVCIFAYGQTGSGKTHTMSGPSGGTSKDMGINYLALNDLFQLSNQREDIIKYDICVQMVEIYNEQVRDLLVEDKADNRVEIRSCNGDGLSLPDATLRSVKSTSDVLTLMKLGEVNRAVSSTAINNRSSRSHSVLTVHVHGKDTSRSTIHSCLHLVDLAGSERVDKSEVTGDRLKEAQFINKSLSCLGDVITALAQKNSHIPYRNSKLTLLLQDSLGGHAKMLMFAHVSPEADSFSETMSTLKFAQRVSTVELGAARLNKETSEVMELKEQLENLKIALANQEAQNAMFNRTKEPYTPSEEPALVSEKTQVRHRRRSIESCSSPKIDKSVNPEDKSGTESSSTPRSLVSENTQFRHRRRSIESCSAPKIDKSVNPEDKSGTESSSFIPRLLVSENTQFRHRRRSSIKNCSAPKIDKSVNPEDKSGTDSSSSIPRSRRLSLEGPKSIKKDTVQTKVTADVSKTLRYESVSLQRHISLQDPESASKSYGHFSNGNSRSELLANAPSSPTSITYQKRLIKIDSEVQIHPIKLPQTPELGRKDADRSTFNDLAAFCNDSQKTKVTSSTNGKESHIRRSLRTIGKLIIGTDKRSQQNVAEVKSPINVTSHTNDVKTPRATTQRTKRRHSLTGMEAPRPNSRRSSLEGNPVVPNVRDRNARTPPPVRPTTKISARWA